MEDLYSNYLLLLELAGGLHCQQRAQAVHAVAPRRTAAPACKWQSGPVGGASAACADGALSLHVGLPLDHTTLTAACRRCGCGPATPWHCPAERYQLSGGEGSRGGWKTELADMQAEVTAAQAALHDDSEADEGSVAWPDSEEDEGGEEGGEEEEESEGEDAAGAGRPAAQPQQHSQSEQQQSQPQRRLSGADLKQVDIRSFFSGGRGRDSGGG